MHTVREVYSLSSSRLKRYCEHLAVRNHSWHLVGAVFGFRLEQQRQTVRVCRNLPQLHRAGCYLSDRSGRDKATMSRIPPGDDCVGDLHDP
jgi:hypothetical protein